MRKRKDITSWDVLFFTKRDALVELGFSVSNSDATLLRVLMWKLWGSDSFEEISISNICSLANLSTATVVKSTKNLESLGLLSIERGAWGRSKGGKKRDANKYSVEEAYYALADHLKSATIKKKETNNEDRLQRKGTDQRNRNDLSRAERLRTSVRHSVHERDNIG